MVEESGTLESQLEATKVSPPFCPPPPVGLLGSSSGTRWAAWVSPFSLALKQPRTAVTLEAAAWSPAWTGRGSLSPQCILLPWQVSPLIGASPFPL